MIHGTIGRHGDDNGRDANASVGIDADDAGSASSLFSSAPSAALKGLSGCTSCTSPSNIESSAHE